MFHNFWEASPISEAFLLKHQNLHKRDVQKCCLCHNNELGQVTPIGYPQGYPLSKKGYFLQGVTFFILQFKKLDFLGDICKPLSGFCVANKKNIYGKRKRLQAAEVFSVKSYVHRMLIDIVGADYRRLFLSADG